MMSSSFGATQRMMRISLRGDAFNFRNGDHGQESLEEQEQRHEQANSADEGPNIDPGGVEQTP